LSGSRNESGYITLAEMIAYGEVFDLPGDNDASAITILRRVDYELVSHERDEQERKSKRQSAKAGKLR